MDNPSVTLGCVNFFKYIGSYNLLWPVVIRSGSRVFSIKVNKPSSWMHATVVRLQNLAYGLDLELSAKFYTQTQLPRSRSMALEHTYLLMSTDHPILFLTTDIVKSLVAHHHHQVPCLIASVLMDIHLSLFGIHASVTVAFFITSQALKLSSNFSLCQPLVLFPSILQVVTKCSIAFCLITWPKNMDNVSFSLDCHHCTRIYMINN